MTKEYMAKLLSGEKTVETRWSRDRRVPYLQVGKKDIIYFKYSAGKVVARARVNGVHFLSKPKDLEKINKFVLDNLKKIGLTDRKAAKKFLQEQRLKKYFTLIELGPLKRIDKFKIDKSGYSIRASWLVIDDIDKIKFEQDQKS